MTGDAPPATQRTGVPRLGFLGVGWIGRDRMRAVASSGVAEVALVADADPAAARAAAEEVGAQVVAPEALLHDAEIDGLVIATPSALHAGQAIAALERGLAVFCQKPLGRSADEVASVVAAARRAGRRLAVDLSYRHLDATRRMRDLVTAGAIGRVYAVDLVFHNAHGPDKPWFMDPARSGGGCVIDLATHLVDLATWMLPAERFGVVASRRFAAGELLAGDGAQVEDHATALLESPSGVIASVSCSWFLHAGRDAVIEATFHGTEGAVAVTNVDGSFYDFEAVLRRRTSREVLASPPDAWGGRAIVAWATELAAPGRSDLRADEAELDALCANARLIDGMYGR